MGWSGRTSFYQVLNISFLRGKNLELNGKHVFHSLTYQA